MKKMKLKDLIGFTWLPVVIASLCCLSPIVLVLLGLATTTFAASLSDKLYYEYAWYFRLAGMVLLGASSVLYFRKQGICTLDQAKRRRNEIINFLLLAIVIGVIGYIVFLYGILEVVGLLLGIW